MLDTSRQEELWHEWLPWDFADLIDTTQAHNSAEAGINKSLAEDWHILSGAIRPAW